MASVGKEPGGRKRVLFRARDGKRKTIRMGKTSIGQAEAFKVKIESLVTSQFSGRVDDETARWLAGLGDRAYGKLVAVGLVEPRTAAPESLAAAGPEPRLGAFLDDYMESRCDVKANTQLVFGRTRKHLIEHFGKDKLLSEITEGDADAWRLYLIRYGLADNTVRRTCGVARQFFRAAVRRRLIQANPFSELTVSVRGNKAREFFVSRADSEKILAACPSLEWKLVFGLARYGGLRTPSETLLLRWLDLNWEQGKMLVHSPKTEHHPGGESRFVPIFPELRGYLLEAFAEAEPGAEFVIAQHRKPGPNLRTHLLRVMAKAGVKPWPKLFQNLRSTRQTELAERWPEHVVCAWLGNSRLVAREHYLQVTEEHFRQAAREPEKAAQNPAQQTRAADCKQLQEGGSMADNNADLQLVAANGASSQGKRMGGAGLEPPAVTPSKTPIPEKCHRTGTESGTLEADFDTSDPELALIVRRWPDLSAEVRAAVVRIVREHTPQPERKESP